MESTILGCPNYDVQLLLFCRLYPLLLRRLTLTTTGLLGFSLQTLCLTFCVLSVWAPGSPFSLASWDYSISSNISLVIHDDNISQLQPSRHDEVSRI